MEMKLPRRGTTKDGQAVQRCGTCLRYRPLEEFTRSQGACRECRTEARHFRKYRLYPIEYDRLVAKQNGCCASCGEQTDALVVDHDHSTGKVRGLLCHPCNKALGFLRDDPSRIQRLYSYLTKTD